MNTQLSALRPASHVAGFFRYAFYPLALAATAMFILHSVQLSSATPGQWYPRYLVVMAAVLLLAERAAPLRAEWGMTWQTFFQRDLPMLTINGAAIAATTALVTDAAGHWGEASGMPQLGWPWWIEAVLAILVSDLLWYWVHRWSHEGRDRIGRWLWRTHVHHHLPEEVYVLMHVVSHPLNTIYVRLILIVPPILLGLSKEAIFAAAVLTAFQGLVSHFNVDVRAGWINQVLIGTELHRYHHSADPAEAKNYGAVITLWDRLFGTFVYRPERLPVALGVEERKRYPGNGQWLALMLLPFRRRDR